jgi:hypothetical protein
MPSFSLIILMLALLLIGAARALYPQLRKRKVKWGPYHGN